MIKKAIILLVVCSAFQVLRPVLFNDTTAFWVLGLFFAFLVLKGIWKLLAWSWTTFWYVKTDTDQGPLYEHRWQ